MKLFDVGTVDDPFFINLAHVVAVSQTDEDEWTVFLNPNVVPQGQSGVLDIDRQTAYELVRASGGDAESIRKFGELTDPENN